MHQVILLIGGNEGDRFTNIMQTRTLISERVGVVVKSSSYYESEPWGFNHQQNFINQIIEVKSDLNPHQILKIGQEIELQLGRRPKTQIGYEGRTMDIDILFYESIVLNDDSLIIPHSKLHERMFTLMPLVEKWEGLIHPKLNKTVKTLASECTDIGWVRKL